jgi:hypothetical protein
MVRHVGMLRFRSDATTEQRAAVRDGLLALRGAVPGIEALEAGLDAGLREGNYDLVFSIDFTDADSWRAYAGHPAHQALVTELIGPIIADKAFVQLEVGGT